MKTSIRFYFLIFLALAIPGSAFASGPVSYGPVLQAGQVLDSITNTFQSSTGSWMSSAQGYAKGLFLSLALLEFTWAAIQLTLKKGDLQDMLASTAFKVLGIGFFYSLLMEAPTWIPAIMNSFGMAGAAVGGSAMLSPSGVFDQGLSVASAMVSAMNTANSGNVNLTNVLTSGGTSIGSFLFGAIVTGLSGLLAILAFTVVAVQLMVTLIESYVIIGGGMLMLGFMGSRWTLPFGEKYFGYAVSTGIKLFTLYLIVGQGQNVANAIVHGLMSQGHAPGPVDFMGAGASTLAYGAMGYMVPAMAGSMMNGAPALSMGSMAGAGSGMAGSLISGAALAGSTLLSGAGMVNAFSKTTKAAGSIGGETTPPLAGSVGGMAKGATPATAAFGAGTSSPVAAPGAMNTATAASAKPVPAPAAAGGEGSKGGGSGMSVGMSPNLSTGGDVSSKGGVDAVSNGKKSGLDLGKHADNLNDMARRMDRLPANDGHSGGVSIKFNHIE